MKRDDSPVYRTGDYAVYQVRDGDGNLLDKVILDDGKKQLEIPCLSSWTIVQAVHYLERFVSLWRAAVGKAAVSPKHK